VADFSHIAPLLATKRRFMTSFLPKTTQSLDLKKLFIPYPKPSTTFQLDEKHSRNKITTMIPKA
jgi:hypothetical protein